MQVLGWRPLAIGPGRLLLYNDVAARLFGPRHLAVLGRPLAEAFPESYLDVVPFYASAFPGSTVVVPARPVAVSKARLRLQLEAQQALLLSLGDALRAQSSTEGLIEVAAQLLGEHLAASSVTFAEFHEAHGEADIFHGWFANGARPFPAVMRLENYEGPVLDDLRAGRTVRIKDTRDPALARPDLAAIAEYGVTALLSVLLVVAGRIVMNLSVYQHAARCWTDAEVALVREVAERLWADLVRARAEERLRKSEARLSEAFRIQTVGVMFWGERASA